MTREEEKANFIMWLGAIEEEASDKLNEWESTFISDLRRRFDSGWYALSDKQAQALGRIYERYTS